MGKKPTKKTVHLRSMTLSSHKHIWFVNNGILDLRSPAQTLRLARHHFWVSKVLEFKKTRVLGFLPLDFQIFPCCFHVFYG